MSEQVVRQPSDHAARARALDPRESFLVQAPAGSGKTELLTDRILALLPTVSRPEEIVAITFTRKAASEMHARVLLKLQRAQSDVPPEGEQQRRSWTLARAALAHDAKHDWQLMAHPARLSIRTIDSFCAGLVRAMPWLSGLGGMPAITDDARVHFDAAAVATLQMAESFEPIRRLIDHLDVDVAAARDALAGMLGHRDQWMPLLAHGADREVMQADLAQAVAEDLAGLVQHMPPGWFDVLGPCARAAVAVLDGNGATHKLGALADWQVAPDADAGCIAQWRALAELLLTATGTLRSPRGINKNLGFPPGGAHKAPFTDWLAASDPDALWVARLARVRDLPDPHFTDAQWSVLQAQLVALTLATAQLRVRFSQATEVDFIEIAQRVTLALGNADEPGELLLKLDASIRHLLIDEFQDTSQSQIDLLERLIAGWEPGDGRSLFLVGDPMQSIYRFRKAEVGLFLQVRDHGLGAIKPTFLKLTDNFRSQAGIVDWVNKWFADLMPTHDHAPSGAIAYTRAQAFHGALTGPAVTFHPAWLTDDAAVADEQAYTQVVQCIQRIRSEGAKDRRESIAILVRARSHVGALAKKLSAAGIAFRAVELVPLTSRPAVSDLVQLVRALAHPADRLAWLSVLRSPMGGLRLDDLHALVTAWPDLTVPDAIRRSLATPATAQAQANGTTLSDEARLRLRYLADVVLDDALVSGALPYAARIASLWRDLGGARLYPGDHAASDAESFFGLLERIAPYGDLNLDRLDTAVQRLFAQPDSGEAEVDIMTMHKSKGLQFDHVLLFGLHRAPRGDQAPLVRFEQSGGRVLFGPIKARADTEADPLSRYLAVRERQRSAYETDRLLYVAATRACLRLHLFGHVHVDPASGALRTPSGDSLLARLWRAVSDDLVPVVPSATAPHTAQPQWTGAPLQRVRTEALVWARQQSVLPEADSTFGAAPVAAWSPAPAYEAAIGTLAHAWLDQLGRMGAESWERVSRDVRVPQIERQLTRAGVPETAATRAAQAVWETLEATLADERGRWLLSQAGARREWPLIDVTGRVSVIDLALSTDAGWLIVDYKTGIPHPDESLANFSRRMRARYADQLRRYCEQVTALDQRPAQAALYFPRAALWLPLD